MTYLKTLIALTMFALLTACAGGVAVNNTFNSGPTGPCVTNPFGTTCANPTETQRVTFCRDATKTTDTKTDDCAPTVFSVCDANAFDTLCPDDAVKEEAFCRDTAKSTGTKANDCAQIVMTACTDDFFDTICNDITEYENKRTEFNSMCINEPGKTKDICDMEVLARTCGRDPFATGCEAGYAPQRKTTCASEITSTRCIPTVMLFCGTDSKVFDTYCTAPAHVDKRVDLCLTGDTNPLCDGTNGTNGITNTFCTANPFDPRAGCAADAYNMARKTACESGDKDRKECEATVLLICDVPNGFRDDFCRGLMRYDDLLEIANNTPDPCAGGVCVDVADLPTYPTTPVEKSPTAGDAFADGFLSVKLIAPTGGKSLLNPDGTENTTIDTSDTSGFSTTVRLIADSLEFGRRGRRGSHDDDGFVFFIVLKGATGAEFSQQSYHGAILSTTNLGAPLTEAPTTAVWPGHFYRTGNRINATDFYVMFESLPNNQIGRIGFANPTKDGIGTGADRPDFTKGQTNIVMDVTFDANGVLSGTIIPAGLADPAPVTGLIGIEGVVGVSAASVSTGFTATNPDGGAEPVLSLEPCITGLAACYGTHAFWLSNARTSTNTDFLTVRSAGVATATDPRTNLITGDTTVLNMLAGEGITVDPNYTVTLSALSDSTDTNSGFGLAFALNDDFTINNYYFGLLSGTNVGAPFTDANQPAAEWSGFLSLYATVGDSHRDEPITLAVSFDDANGGTIGHATDTYTYFNDQQDENHNDIQRFSINGKFDANGVIYGGATYRYFSNSLDDYDVTLSGLIGVNGAVAVFGGLTVGDADTYAGGFVARPKPTP